MSADREDLQKELKSKFGIDLVFFGKKDAPYGYLIVDHANKTVIHGARVLAMDELLDFATPEERFERIENYIDQLLSLNPKITQGEIFQKLRKQRAYIKKGVIYFEGKSQPLKPFMQKPSTGTTASITSKCSVPLQWQNGICSARFSKWTVRTWWIFLRNVLPSMPMPWQTA